MENLGYKRKIANTLKNVQNNQTVNVKKSFRVRKRFYGAER